MVETTQDNNPDLEKVRDERCIPVARGVLVDISTDLLPADFSKNIDLKPITLKTLQRAYDADLNLTTETSYVVQLVLKALSSLNAAVQGCTTEPIDEVRFAAIGNKILSILATANVTLTKTTPEEDEKEFAPVKEQINAFFAQEKLTLIEVKYIMENIFDSFGALNNMYSAGLEQSLQKAEARLFGVEVMSDVTMKKLDEVLKKSL